MAVAIVTGAGGGIGRAVGVELARRGYDLVAVGRTEATLQETVAAVVPLGVEGMAVVADVREPEAAERIVGEAMEAHGRIDVLVNTAGCAPMIPTHEVTPAQWREILDTNLSAAFYLTRAVWPHMQRQHLEYLSDHRNQRGEAPVDPGVNTGGVIVNFSSEAARDPFPGLGAYACAKVGVNMLTKVTAVEGQPAGIRVFCVAPAGVETPMFRQLLTPEQVPTEKILQPGDVAAVVGELVGGAMRYCSGETIYVHKRMV